MVSRSQIRRAGERLRRDETPSDADRQIYAEYRDTFEEPLREVSETIKSFVDDAPVHSRLKRFETMVEKLRRSTSDLSRLEDIAGCRVVLPTMTAQREVFDRIRATWDVIRNRDYQATPRDGYRALHIVVQVHERPVEVQVRTALEDLWANASEALAANIDADIKYGGGPPEVREILDNASLLCAGLDAAAVGQPELKSGGHGDAPDLRGALAQLLEAVAVIVELHALRNIPSGTLPREFEVALSDERQRIVDHAIHTILGKRE